MTPSTTTAGSGRERTVGAPAAAAEGPQVPVRAPRQGSAAAKHAAWLLAAVVVLFIVCAVSLA
ncbi:MAG: iron ABC transporter permease, partial [Actinomycetota bacterium]|nr:iron ABC transporter permease [Actinomycetota bacterium]